MANMTLIAIYQADSTFHLKHNANIRCTLAEQIVLANTLQINIYLQLCTDCDFSH